MHISEIWCEGDDKRFEYIWNWLARLLQAPHLRAETAVILRSGQGTGKNIVADIFVEFFGIHGMTVTSQEQLVGRFSGHLGQCVFLFANEALWGGDKKSEGILKSLITDKFRTTEEKFMPVTTTLNFIHLMLATNNDWAAPMDLDDRRYFVLDVSETKKGDSEYFKALKHEIDHGGKGALLYELINTDISQFDHRSLPRNQGSSKLVDQLKTADPIIRWWFDCLLHGDIKIKDKEHGPESALQFDEWQIEDAIVAKEKIHDSYLFYCAKHRVQYIHDPGVFLKTLYNKFNFDPAKTFTSVRVAGRRQLRIVSQPESRDLFEKALNNQKIDWDEI